MTIAAALAASLLVDPVTPASVPSSSPVAEIITATLAGLATVIAAVAGVWRLRRNRDAAASALPVESTDPEDRPARLRERISVAETEIRTLKGQVADLAEQVMLHRSVDVALEATAAASRRRRTTRE